MISKLPIRSRHFQKTNPNLYQQDRNAGQDEGEQCFDPFLFQCSLTHVHQNELMVATCLNLSILHIEPMSHFVTLLKQGHRFLGIDLCDDQYIEGCERKLLAILRHVLRDLCLYSLVILQCRGWFGESCKELNIIIQY